MKKRILLLLLVISTTTFSYSQSSNTRVAGKEVSGSQISPLPESTQVYSPKPKSAWELGIHAGHLFFDGDVDPTQPGGYGLGLHLRKAINYTFSLRGDLMFGQATGLDPQASAGSGIGGNLIFPVFNSYRTSTWFPSYKVSYVYGGLQGVVNIGNILFHQPSNKWNWYGVLGIGLSNHSTKLDLTDANGQAYTNLSARVLTGNNVDLNTKSGRKQIKSNIRDIYDGTYETDGPKKVGIFRLGDETNIHVLFTAGMGISRKLSKRLNLGLEHQVMLSDNDLLDGMNSRSAVDQSNSNDIGHYTNLRLGINLGNFDKVTEPLYWMNPLDATMTDIALLKARPVLDLTDSDGDGIIDMLDQEKNSPIGALVDTRGVTLDSDGDKIPDFKDKEPYSPAGYAVDANGVAIGGRLTEADVNRLIDIKGAKWCAECKSGSSECGKWFLPMIHYDLNKSTLKPEFFGHLHHVATVMKMCPNTCITVVGHTDARSSSQYNSGLSYKRANTAMEYLISKYGIDRSRFKLMYDGEEELLIGNSGKEIQHYMNRRVEFRVCESNDTDMPAPAGSNGKRVGTRSGSNIKGDKNAGF